MSPSALTLLQVGAALLLVLLVATLCLALLKRVLSGRLGRKAGGLKPVATLPLGERRFLMVVQIGNEGILIGVTPQSVNLVARGVELSEPRLTSLSPAADDRAVVAS